MIMTTKRARARARARAARWMAMATKRARARAGRGMAMATRVAGDKKGNCDGNEEDDGNQQQQHGKLLRRRGWWAFDGGNDGDGVKDTAACATIGERGMMVAKGHGLCVFLVCVERSQKIRKRAKSCMYPRT
jgi:hypothetical protein